MTAPGDVRWDDDAAEDTPAEPSNRQGWRWAKVVCCARCDSMQVERYSTKGALGYWRCGACAHDWRMPIESGSGKARVL